MSTPMFLRCTYCTHGLVLNVQLLSSDKAHDGDPMCQSCKSRKASFDLSEAKQKGKAMDHETTLHECPECGFARCTCRLRPDVTLHALERHLAALGEASLAVQHAREGWYACVSCDGENYHAGPERSLAQAIDAAIASVWETR